MTTCPNLYLLPDLSSEHKIQLFNCLLSTLNESPMGNSNAACLKSNSGLISFPAHLQTCCCSHMPISVRNIIPPNYTLNLFLQPFSSYSSSYISSVDHCRILLTGHPFFKSLLSTVHPEPADVHMSCKNTLYAFTSPHKKVQSMSLTGQTLYDWVPLCIWLSFSKLLNTPMGFRGCTYGFLSACSIFVLLLHLMNSFNYCLNLKLPPLWSHASMHAQLSIRSIP